MLSYVWAMESKGFSKNLFWLAYRNLTISLLCHRLANAAQTTYRATVTAMSKPSFPVSTLYTNIVATVMHSIRTTKHYDAKPQR